MADGYAKLVLRGTASGQEIRNILYYGTEDGDVMPWSPALAGQIAAVWAEDIEAEWVLQLPTTYTLEDIYVEWVDQHGAVVSDYPVVLPINTPGGEAAVMDGPYQCAIIAFRNAASQATSPAARNLKRSYIAYGPLVSTFIENDGSVNTGTLALDTLLGLLDSPIVVGFDNLVPMRVGRTLTTEAPAVGMVVDAYLRPFASVRRSRKVRPSGA